MKNIIRKFLCFIMLFTVVTTLRAQHTVDTVPYSCNFENLIEQGFWRLANGSTNKWWIGSATNNGGSYSLYITNDNGVNNSYNTSSTANNYAVRQLYMTSGMYEISYDWKCLGEQCCDYIRAFLVPASINPTFTGGNNNYSIGTSGTPTNWISIDNNEKMNNNSAWTHYNNPRAIVPTTGNYYLIFFWHNDGSVGSTPAGAIDNIIINPVSCPQPDTLSTTDLGGGRVEVNWVSYGGDPDCGWIVEWDTAGFTPGSGRNSEATMTKPFTITGLREQITYTIYVRAICCDSSGRDTSSYSSPLRFRYCNSANLCPVNFTDLTSSDVTCTYGSFTYFQRFQQGQGPYTNVGVIDNGSDAATSRHTVHRDPSEMDARTNNVLPTIPNGFCESVRLGNWRTGAECEAITYNMLVDTSNYDIILLQYAVVMENPAYHTSSSGNQEPRFMMEILDQNNQLIDATCGQADFASSNAVSYGLSRGWHDARTNGAPTSSSSVLYKEWTPVGINVSSYHGQTIRVRFTNFDCGQYGHYGYAYYTMACQKARITSSNCGGNATEATLTAPAGFNYRWYNSLNVNQTISTNRTVTVTLDSTTYYCEVSFVEAPSCKFTLSVLAIPRFPHASFSATIDTTGCQYKVNVTNNSYTSISAYDTVSLGACETYEWNWGDGNIDYQQNPGQHIYSEPGTYTIMLVSSISEGTCNDTAYYTVTFNPPITPTIYGDSVVCTGTLARVGVNLPSAISYLWSNGATTSTINVYPTDSITYTVHVTDYIGCETDLRFHIEVDTVPLPTLEPSIYESCVPYSLAISDISSASNTNSYTWIWGDGSSTNNNNHPTHTYSEEGEYPLYCCIRSAEGCFDTISRMVYVYGFGHGSFSWNPPIITVTSPVANFINLTNHRSTNLYHWEFFNHDTYSGSSDDFEPSYTWTGGSSEFAGNNLVRLITTNQVRTHSGGTVACVDTVEAYVMIINDFLQFPNVITANGDGVNDIFEIKNLIGGGGYTDNELYIYNHWGRKVYYKKNITTKEDFWDPAANNEPSGTYYYRFAAKGYLGDIQRNGTIQVISK